MSETYFVIEGAPLIPDAVRQVKHFAFDGQALAFDTLAEATQFADRHGYMGHLWRLERIELIADQNSEKTND